MAQIIFYEKPGCINNIRQKKWLRQAGHHVIAKSLLTEDWSKKPQKLREFFAEKPVSDWFNPSAPSIKKGLVDPAAINPHQAINLMVDEPILIRRPLIQVGSEKMSGFNLSEIEQLIGLTDILAKEDLQNCPKLKKLDSRHV